MNDACCCTSDSTRRVPSIFIQSSLCQQIRAIICKSSQKTNSCLSQTGWPRVKSKQPHVALPWCLQFRAGAPPIVALGFADCDCAVDDLHPACLLILPLMLRPKTNALFFIRR